MIDIFPEIKDKIKKMNGVAGIIIQNLDDEREMFKYNENEVFPAASVIKLTIIWKLFKEIDRGKIKLDDEIELKKKDKVGGFGILKELHSGLKVTIKDLATLMIVLSDNTATNILIDTLGMDNINEAIRDLDLKETILQRKMMDIEAKNNGYDNYTTPLEVYKILKSYLDESAFSKKSRELIINIFKRQQCNNKLPVSVPDNIEIAHKTGDLPGVEHDVGLMYINQQQIIVIVLTKGLKKNEDGVKLNNEIGEIIYSYYR